MTTTYITWKAVQVDDNYIKHPNPELLNGVIETPYCNGMIYLGVVDYDSGFEEIKALYPEFEFTEISLEDAQAFLDENYNSEVIANADFTFTDNRPIDL